MFYPLVTSRAEGTGLGLPAAQELISRHGGLIEFESRPGRTVFQVRVPLTTASDATDKELRVWVVDDDQSVRWVLEKALRQADMQTRSFERGEHLLDALESDEPDVLITDVRMPGMSGIACDD